MDRLFPLASLIVFLQKLCFVVLRFIGQLGPGDAFYIPAGWLHSIQSDKDTVALAIFVEPADNEK